jgi:primosomal replication protein N
MRYTPAGIAVVDCILHHVSRQSEAGQWRDVEVEAPAVAFAGVGQRVASCRLDETYRFAGFVANRSRKSKRTVFHITDIEPIPAPPRSILRD